MLDLFFDSAWQVLVAGLILGAGLPAIFALGVRATVVGSGNGSADAGGTAAPSAANRILGVVCFVIVAAAVLAGLTVIIATGMGKEVSFEHIYPTLVAKD